MTAVVYWLLDAEDNILYIGCTSHLRDRMTHHSSVQQWWSSVASVAITDAMPHDVAIQMEREDIIALRPTHNVQNAVWTAQSVFMNESFDSDAFDIADHMTTAVAARALHISVPTLNRWARRGDLPVALKMPSKVGQNLFRRIDVERLAKDRGVVTDIAS